MMYGKVCRKMVYFYFDLQQKIEELYQKIEVVFYFFRLHWSEVHFLLLHIYTFGMSNVWRKHLGRSYQISYVSFFYVGFCMSVFKDLQWSFIVMNGKVLNILSPQQSTTYKKVNKV